MHEVATSHEKGLLMGLNGSNAAMVAVALTSPLRGFGRGLLTGVWLGLETVTLFALGRVVRQHGANRRT